MRPENLLTKIFLDGADPKEAREIKKLLGFLDGQTTNPSLVAKNPDVLGKTKRGDKFSRDELYGLYRSIVREIADEVADGGSVSVEVCGDCFNSYDGMVVDAREMAGWTEKAHIKLPTSYEGLTAAEILSLEGIRVNMTLCFSQEQSAAVYSATSGAKNVFVSPFIGRLDDLHENGIDLIKNIKKMYKDGDSHVKVLSASVRSIDHFFAAISAGTDIITAPFSVLKEWSETGLAIPQEGYKRAVGDLKPISYKEIDLKKDWRNFDIHHNLTDIGIQKFYDDWTSLMK